MRAAIFRGQAGACSTDNPNELIHFQIQISNSTDALPRFRSRFQTARPISFQTRVIASASEAIHEADTPNKNAGLIREARSSFSLPHFLWGGWREAPGGGSSRTDETPPPVTSFAPFTMCHPPHKSGRDRKSRRSTSNFKQPDTPRHTSAVSPRDTREFCIV